MTTRTESASHWTSRDPSTSVIFSIEGSPSSLDGMTSRTRSSARSTGPGGRKPLREATGPERSVLTRTRWPRGFLPAALARRLPEINEPDLYRAIRHQRIPAIKLHGRWFVSVAGLGLVSSMRLADEDLNGGGAA